MHVCAPVHVHVHAYCVCVLTVAVLFTYVFVLCVSVSVFACTVSILHFCMHVCIYPDDIHCPSLAQ